VLFVESVDRESSRALGYPLVRDIREFLTRLLAVAPLVPPGHLATKRVSCGETAMVWGSCLTLLPAMGSELCRVSRRRDRRVASAMYRRKVRLPRREHMARFGHFLGIFGVFLGVSCAMMSARCGLRG
jgi:hypothetical protein